MKTLRERWDETQIHWRDQVRVDFEKHHMDPLQSQVEQTLRAMNQLGEVLARMRKDCAEGSGWGSYE
jgi:hypothetical protein